jgi:hypothetical protein
MKRFALILVLCWLGVEPALADQPAGDRKIRMEPNYRTKTPSYGILTFGPEGKDRVWLVLDGDTLYVDRNGNGDLTEPGEMVTAKKRAGSDPEEDGYAFEVGDVTTSGRSHKALTISVLPLWRYGGLAQRPDVKAALGKDAKTLVVSVSANVDMPGLKGGGLGGRVGFYAGPIDLNGPLVFGATPAEAPVIHFGGPLQITFSDELPRLRVGRPSEFVLVVGTPGVGPGTFAKVSYEGTIPNFAKPVALVKYPSAKPGDPPREVEYEIKDRC